MVRKFDEEKIGTLRDNVFITVTPIVNNTDAI